MDHPNKRQTSKNRNFRENDFVWNIPINQTSQTTEGISHIIVAELQKSAD